MFLSSLCRWLLTSWLLLGTALFLLQQQLLLHVVCGAAHTVTRSSKNFSNCLHSDSQQELLQPRSQLLTMAANVWMSAGRHVH